VNFLRSAILIAGLSGVAVVGASAQTSTFFYYNEVVKEGVIYVFASPDYEAVVKSGDPGAATRTERQGYGPNGETVIFLGQNALNLYNFKHGLPSEPPAAGERPKSTYPSTKFSGLMFGDYYYYYQRHQEGISSSDPTQVEGEHGLWFRRIYFTYDYKYNEKLTTRLRLEMNSNGQFAGGNLTPYAKDAYLRWNFAGKQDLTFGIQPSLAFDWFEGAFWGLRHIEKTPVDLYRLDSSRDFGVTLDGPTMIDGLSYAVQFGNESGNGSETQEGKILRAEGRYEGIGGLALEGYYGFGRRPDTDQHRQTAQGIAGFRFGNAGRAGGQYVWQQRRSGDEHAPHQTISIWSGFGVWEFVPKKANLFARADGVTGHLGDQETGLPGAGGIDYLLLSGASPFTAWIFGTELYLAPTVRLSPNAEIFRYTDDPDPVNNPGRRQDSILRLTFFWSF
jgi:hypothetical protein